MTKNIKNLVLLSAFIVLGQFVLGQVDTHDTFVKKAYIKQYPISVNEQVTKVLIFPAPISTNGVDLGSADIIASAVDGVSNILKIKAATTNSAATNLTVITTDGKIYSFWANYDPKANSIPVDLRLQNSEEQALAQFNNRILTDQQISDLAEHIATREPFLNSAKARSYRIKARLEGIYISADVLFFQIKLENKTNIDYEEDFTRYYIRGKNRSKRTAEHEEELKPFKTYFTHGKITAGKTTQQIILAFPKFTIADQKNFVIQLFEKAGDRHLELKIDGNEIIKAQPLDPITQ